MFKQLQELQRRKKLEELNDAKKQNVMDQLSLMHYKQSSGTQYPLLNYGIPVRDASQMFKFGNSKTNSVQGLSNRSTQNQTENVSRNQDLDPLEQKILFNMEDNKNWGTLFGKHGSMGTESIENMDHASDFPSLQSGSWSTLMQSAVAEASSGDAEALKLPKPELISSFPIQHVPATDFQNPKITHSDANHQSPKEAGQGFLPDVPRNFIDKSAGFPAPNSTSQASHNMLELLHKVDKEYSHETQSGDTNSAPITKAPKAEPDDAFTPSYDNASCPQSFGLKLAPQSQRQLVNCFHPCRTSLQAGHSSKPFQDPQSNNNQLGNQNQSPLAKLSSHLVSVKNEDGQQSSTLEAKQHPMAEEMAQENVWVDVQQNPCGIGSSEPPSTSYAANSRMETASEASKRLDYWKHVKSENNFSETDPRNHSLVNPMNYDPSRRAAIKIEKVTCDDKIPQATSLAQPNSAYGSCMNHPGSSAATGDQLVKSSSQPPLQDSSPDIATYDKASSWSKNHEATNNEKMSMNDAKVRNKASQHLVLGGPCGSLERNSSLVQVASVDQCGSTRTNKVALPRLPSFYPQHLNVANQNMAVLKSKKRKCPTFEPWHEVVTEGCLGLHDMSTAEMEWARSANRLPEKLKEEAREVAHSRGVVHPKRRLILTTQLMQLLFRPVPAMASSEDAIAYCDTVTYYAAKLALGDACSLAGHSCTSHDISGSSSRTTVIPKRFGHQNLLKTVQGFIDRSKRLEDELLRLEEGESSILDVRVEFQDLDKYSVINRFAKLHSRGPFVTADTASSGGASTVPKLYPQRYVTARPMPRMVPEGLRCLSI